MGHRSSINILTLGYLLLAITACSKGGGGSGGPGDAYVANGAPVNYSVQSNCSESGAEVSAIQVIEGTIVETRAQDGEVTFESGFDFQEFGFPNGQAVIGVTSTPMSEFADRVRACVAIPQGSSVRYDCYEGQQYLCTSTFAVLPAGDL